MYIIFNKDGSVKEEQLDTYVNQHSDGVNFIDIAIDGYDYNTYTASASFLLPNSETLTATAHASKEIVTSCGAYNGWRFYLYSAETQYEGDLSFSVIATQSNTQLFTYLVKITINATAKQLSTSITWDEYTQLLRTISDYQLQYSPTNVRAYMGSPYAYEKDLDNLAVGQAILTYGSGTYNARVVYQKSDGTKAAKLIPHFGYESLKDYFVQKGEYFTSNSQIQEVLTGLCSYYTGTDGVSVNYGQNPSEFYALVTKDSGANYAGEINLGAKAVQIETGMEVDGTHIYSFKADQNTTELKNPTTGTSTLTLGTGSATLSANTVSLKDGNSEVYLGTGYGGSEGVVLKSPFTMLLNQNGTVIMDATGSDRRVTFYKIPWLDSNSVPTFDRQLTPKKYVDDQDASVKTYAADLVSKDHEDLQAQIDAINASQNFVATYATKADMPTPPVSGLDDKDCVLVLQDESHENKAYVYKYASTGWIEVGPIGDYATSTELNTKISALPIRSGTGISSARIGLAVAANGNASVAGGEDAIASGDNAFALGRHSEASGSRSYALGASAMASGDYSYALGAGASATAERACAIGQSVANATEKSVAIGSNFTAPAGATFSVGADNKVLLSASSSAIAASAPSITVETEGAVFEASQTETKLQSPDGASYLQLNKQTDSEYNAIFQAPSFTLTTDYAGLDATYISLGSDALEAKASMYYLGKAGGGSYLLINKSGATFGVSPKCSTAPTVGAHLTNKTYVDNQISALPISKDASGNAVISGDLSVGGTFTATKFKAIEAETLDTERYTIGLAKGNTSAITSYVGLYASKYDGTNDGALVWDSTGTAYVGDASVDSDGKVTDPNKTLQPLLTRGEASSLSDKAILAWDADSSKAVASEYFGYSESGNAFTMKSKDGSSYVQVNDSNARVIGKGLLTLGSNQGNALLTGNSILIETSVSGGRIAFLNYEGIALTIEGGVMKANELDNASGNALVRFKETEAKNVFGGVNYDAVLMGKSDRPYYSKSGSDFNGSALALASDITTMATATSDSTDVSE